MSHELGNHSYSTSDIGRNVEVGKFVSIAGGFRPHCDDDHPWVGNRKAVSNYPFKERWQVDYSPSEQGKGKIVIGNDVWIGEDVIVLSGVHIGDGAIVGAGAVVTKSVPPYALVAGNPARVKKFRFTPQEIKKLLRIKWWDWTDEKIKENIHLLSNIDLLCVSV